MIPIIGLIMFVAASVIALSRKTHLIVPFIAVPIIAGIACGFPFTQVLGFASKGVASTFNSVMVCIFAIMYFSILSETGMFDIIVKKLVSITKGNIYVIMLITVIVAFIAHLDGAYNTAFLIAIPALAPLYKKLKIDMRMLILLIALAATPTLALPWSNPVKLVIYDKSVNAVTLGQKLYPVMYITTALVTLFALGYAHYYSKKNAAELKSLTASIKEESAASNAVDFSDKPLARPKRFWINMVIFLSSLVCFMVITSVDTYLLFMIFSILTLVFNYDAKAQGQILKKHSAMMLAPSMLFLAIGVMVGVINGTGMVTQMVKVMMAVVPASMARYTHVIFALIIMPLEVFVPYQAFTSITPLLLGIGKACGLTSYQVLSVNVITFLNPASPLVAANNLAAEIGGVDIIELVKYSFLPAFVFNIITVLLCVLLGLA